MSFISTKSLLTKVLFLILGAAFLATMFLSLFYMSAEMDMSAGMTDCPLMLDQSVICQMDVHDHMSAWKSIFLSISPTFVLLLASLGSIGLTLSLAPNLVKQLLPVTFLPYRRSTERPYTFSYRALQELFSSGILHPKLYNVDLR